METTVHVRGDVAMIELSGPLRLCDEDELPALITSLLERGFLKVLLNLHQVHNIDSTGLDGIVRAYTMVRKKGGRLTLLNVQKRLRTLLDVTKLSTVFQTFDSEEQALRNFDGPVSAVS